MLLGLAPPHRKPPRALSTCIKIRFQVFKRLLRLFDPRGLLFADAVLSSCSSPPTTFIEFSPSWKKDTIEKNPRNFHWRLISINFLKR